MPASKHKFSEIPDARFLLGSAEVSGASIVGLMSGPSNGVGILQSGHDNQSRSQWEGGKGSDAEGAPPFTCCPAGRYYCADMPVRSEARRDNSGAGKRQSYNT